MQAIATILTTGTLGSSGCLVDRQVVPDDVVDLDPLIPPSILEDDLTATNPLPGSITLLPAGQTFLEFAVRIYRNPGAPLVAKWFVDRDRPCDPSTGTCGSFRDTHAVVASDATAFRTERETISVFTTPHCYRVDLYVAGDFQIDTQFEHLPVRQGDSAHARFFVVTPDATGNYPNIQSCIPASGKDGAGSTT